MQLRHTIIKAFVYCGLVVLVWLIIYADARWPLNGEGQKFTEHSYTEYAQEIILFMVAGLFFLTAVRVRPTRSFGLLMTAFFTLALIRELDGFFDSVWHGFWKVPYTSGLELTWSRHGLSGRPKDAWAHNIARHLF